MTHTRALATIAKLAIIPALKRLAAPANMLDLAGYSCLFSERASSQRRQLLAAWYVIAGMQETGVDDVMERLYDSGYRLELLVVESERKDGQKFRSPMD